MKNLYLLAILPPPELSVQIDEIRKECAARYRVQAGLKPPVHLTLFRPFSMENELEPHLYKLLRQASRHHHPFELELENFSSFHIHTLYIRVLKHAALSALQKEVAGVMNRNKIDPRETKSGNTLFTPHITIAYRDIPEEIFPGMWEEYKNRKFKRSFRVDRFMLLKHNGRNWQTFKEFELYALAAELTLF